MDTTPYEALINPFAHDVLDQKLLDGKVTRSSGIRLRTTGEIVSGISGPSLIALVPNFSDALYWTTLVSGAPTPGVALFVANTAVKEDRRNIKKIRYVSAGLKLNLINNNETNDGYWEAARIPFDYQDFSIDADTGAATPLDLADPATINLSQYQTYQQGKLRDLHRVMFTLNSQETEHFFSNIQETISSTGQEMLDTAYDMVIIKIYGRQGPAGTTPSTIMYDCVANQEVVYAENTQMARLMTSNHRDPNYEIVLEAMQNDVPAQRLAAVDIM
jgi:hypothetical protein